MSLSCIRVAAPTPHGRGALDLRYAIASAATSRRVDVGKAGCGSAWLERCVRDAEVAGSNPVTPTFSSAYLVDSFAFRNRPLDFETPRRLPPRLFDSSEFACVNRRYGQCQTAVLSGSTKLNTGVQAMFLPMDCCCILHFLASCFGRTDWA